MTSKTKKEIELENLKEAIYEGADGTMFTEEEWLAPVLMGSPSRQEIEEWKRKHESVYFLPFESEIYIFRKLKRPEYKSILRDSELTALDREEKFTETCVLFPRDYTIEDAKNGNAGVPSLLTEIIMEKSGFHAKTGAIKL